jgi:hypothetical protein
MKMGVKDALTSLCTSVKYVSVANKPSFAGYLRGGSEELGGNSWRNSSEGSSVFYMKRRNNQEMRWSLRIDVIKCDNVFTAKNDFCRYFASNYSAKETG